MPNAKPAQSCPMRTILHQLALGLRVGLLGFCITFPRLCPTRGTNANVGRIFGYPHVGISNAKCWRWGVTGVKLCKTRFAFWWTIGCQGQSISQLIRCSLIVKMAPINQIRILEIVAGVIVVMASFLCCHFLCCVFTYIHINEREYVTLSNNMNTFKIKCQPKEANKMCRVQGPQLI